MLPVKPWTLNAVLRLLLGVVICVLAGSVISGLLHPVRPLQWVVSAAALGCLAATLVLTHRPWNADTLLGWLIRVLLCFYASLLLGMWAQKLSGVTTSHQPSVGRMLVATLSMDGGALALIVLFLRETGSNWTEAFGLSQQRGRAILLGLVAAIVFLPVGLGLQQLSSWVLTHLPGLHLPPEEQLSIKTLRLAAGMPARVALGVVTILLAPAAEELLFRGILYPWIKKIGYPRLALWGTALLFALVHFNAATFLPLTALALVLIGLYEWTGNLLASIAAHSLFNAVNFALLYLVVEKAAP